MSTIGAAAGSPEGPRSPGVPGRPDDLGSPGVPGSPGRPGSPDGPGPGAVTFRMFASARAAAGTGEVHMSPGPTAEVVAALAAGLPPRFTDVLAASSLVADGHRLDHSSPEPVPGGTVVDVLPPFAGG